MLSVPSAQKTRVLIVDDSAVVRKFLSQGLALDPNIEVIGTASSADIAQRMIELQRPDVITLDLEMPGTDGLTFLKEYMADRPIPTVVISSQTRGATQKTLEALEAGAVDVIAKPRGAAVDEHATEVRQIARRVVAAATAKLRLLDRSRKPRAAEPSVARNFTMERWVVAIGASTGGVQALASVLPKLPKETPPIVIVQHMPEGFTGPYARRLNDMCQIQVREAVHGDLLEPGVALIAPGGLRHMIVNRAGGHYRVQLIEGEQVCHSRPSVDVLFNSVAEQAKRLSTAVILTGMGRDGAQGMLRMRQAGARTFAQNEKSCIVYGMPQAAYKIGAAEEMVHLDDVPERLLDSIGAQSMEATEQKTGRSL